MLSALADPSILLAAGSVGPPALDLFLPTGYEELPPWPFAVVLVVILGMVIALLWALDPVVDDRTVLALSPWIVTGGVMHVLYQQGAFPETVAPLFGTLFVYVTVSSVAGLVWIGSVLSAQMRSHGVAYRPLGVIGTGVAVTFIVLSVYTAIGEGVTIRPFFSAIALVVAALVAAVVWIAISLKFTEAAAATGAAGALVVFSHAVDGVSTAIGYDLLGVTERTPLSRVILEAGESLPTAEFVGAGWLFVLVKLALAAGIVVLFREWAREDPRQARLVLLLLAAVGLGPGFHNLLLFAVAG